MGSIHMKASVILALYDAYTNGMVRETGLRVTVQEGIRAIAKGNGYYVFLESADCNNIEILIESPLYQTRKLQAVLQKEVPRYLSVRLNPSSGYPFPPGTTFLKGRIEDCIHKDKTDPADGFCCLHIVLLDEMNPVRLVADYQKGETAIALFGVGEEPEGQTFLITNAAREQMIDRQTPKQPLAEEFVLGRRREEVRMGYHLAEGLQCTYQRGSSSVLRMHRVEVKRDGSYFAAFGEVPIAGTSCRISWKTETGTNQAAVIPLVQGIDNHYQG